MKTFSMKAGEIQRKWYLVDASGKVTGRLASILAKLLRGKNDPRFTPHMNHGACVVVINADKVLFTAKKDPLYYRHTGYPGGIKCTTASGLLSGPFSHRVLEKAVQRMLGKAGPLPRDRMRNLYVYAGETHPHQAQNPLFIDVGSFNSKNRKPLQVS